MIKNPFCRPRLRAAATRKSGAMSLLDRLREAVFRLIMVSALSRGSSATARRRSSRPTSDCRYYPNDPINSEAVADCIEFIKKSATMSEESHRSSAGGYEDAAAAQVVTPLPVV